MLKEIVCDKFKKNDKPRDPIKFNKGLNTILGSNAADNSIGKSTFLLIIDFCFGGDTYWNSDVKKYIGNHTIKFSFEFADGLHYYSRSTSDPKHVSICNENYEEKKNITIKSFRELLMEGYQINIEEVTFRGLVSPFFRVAGKNNDTIINPLHNGTLNEVNAITILEKLFNLYQYVSELNTNLKNVKNKKTTYLNARKLALVPNEITTQKQYEKNISLIQNLIEKKTILTQNTDSAILKRELQLKNVESDVTNQLKEMKRKYGQLISKYRVVTKNKDEQFITTEDDLHHLLNFFPNANIKHIEEIESFHRNLSGILDSELKEEAKSLQLLINNTTMKIQELEQQLINLDTPLYIPKSFLDEYSDIERQIVYLHSQNESYIKIKNLKTDTKYAEEELKIKEMEILTKIENQINNQMQSYNDFIYESKRESPKIHFKSKSKYDFTTPRDDGTGTAYKSLILLDLSILKLTSLPIIGHDSSIFKNIGDEPIDKIMKLYSQSEKQIFIALDKAQGYSNDTNDILNKTAILHLNPNGEELFGKCWAIKENNESNT